MDTKTFDWKDVANSQFDKAFTLALLILLFGIMVTPRVDIKRQKFSLEQMQAIILPPEEREEIEPPEDIARPVIDIIIDDVMPGDDTTDPEVIKMLREQLGLDILATNSGSGGESRLFDFVPYEYSPEPINPVSPDYPPIAQKMNISGVVILEVDVYKDGTTGNINVLKSLMPGPGGLDEAAKNAVKKWKFQPGTSGGKAVDTTVIIPVDFTLTK